METEICHNCKREVPQQNYLMHVAHCARNMTVCPICGDAVRKAHLKDHCIKEHTLVECPACRNKVQVSAMDNHRANSCGRRTIACEYCELELPKDDLVEHELYCGARTERCDQCSELVMHKYRKLHIDSNHGFLKLSDEPGPTPSWETIRSNNRTYISGPLNTLNSISNVLPLSNRNVIEANASALEVPAKSKKLDEENGFLPLEPPPLRDTPRTYVAAYDASEDLRAKVKLARHDLNNIKNTYLLQGDERIRQLQQQQSSDVRGVDLLATNRQPRSRFTTNLVPYEKNKSFKVNALPDEERAVALGTVPQPLMPFAGTGNTIDVGTSNAGYFNYLGGREETIVPVVPLSSKLSTNNTSHPKKSTNMSGGNSKNSTGAVPRTTRKKGPAPPIPTPLNTTPTTPTSQVHHHEDSIDDKVTLPCEFCGKMILASFLVQHETACRPDLAQLKLKSKPITETIASAGDASATEVELPCEFCSDLYPMSKLLSHQALCDISN